MKLRDLGVLIKEAAVAWYVDKASRLGAALAYYTTFSIGPLLLLTIAVAGAIFGEEAAKGRLLHQLRDLMGEEGAEVLQAVIANANGAKSQSGGIAAIAGAAMLLFGATGLFGALQDALDTVWEVQPRSDRGVWGIIHGRFLSLTMVMGVAFLLLVSLVVSAVLAAVSNRFGPGNWGLAGQLLDSLVSFSIITLLFAMIFKYLPDAVVPWSDVWFGSLVTSLLFTIGKLGIGLYLGQSAIASTYGAAGSLAVLMVWFYYSAQIFLFGAELTKTHARRFGMGIVPSSNAGPMTAEVREQQGMPPADAAIPLPERRAAGWFSHSGRSP